MPRADKFGGRALVAVAACASAGVVGLGFAGDGVELDGVRAGIRYTARLSLVLLFFAFVASSVNQLRSDATGKWLLRNRKYLGLSFAVSHFTHLGLILAYAAAYPTLFRANVGTFAIVGGGIGYLFLLAMTITSFDGPKRLIGRRTWKLLHTGGMYVFWAIFANSYINRTLTDPAYAPLALLVLIGVGLRVAAWLHRRSRSRARATA